MLSVENWKRRLARLGFTGSISAWPEPFGSDLMLEAIPDSRAIKSVQKVFKVGANDNRAAKELLKDFSKALRAVLDEAKEQVVSRVV